MKPFAVRVTIISWGAQFVTIRHPSGIVCPSAVRVPTSTGYPVDGVA